MRQTLGRVLPIAVANGVDQRFVQAEFDALTGHQTSDRFDQNLHQRCQLKGGGQNEIGPPELRNGRDRFARRRDER